MIVDSVFENTGTAVLTFPASQGTGDGTTGVTLDNVKFVNVQKGVADNNGKVYHDGKGTVDIWVLGRIYLDQRKQNVLSAHYHNPRNPTLLGSNQMGLPRTPYFERSKPQYESILASQFVNMRNHCAGQFSAFLNFWLGQYLLIQIFIMQVTVSRMTHYVSKTC